MCFLIIHQLSGSIDSTFFALLIIPLLVYYKNMGNITSVCDLLNHYKLVEAVSSPKGSLYYNQERNDNLIFK